MAWFTHAVQQLTAGREATVRPTGNSMTPKVRSKATATLRPNNDPAGLKTGDIVLVKVNGNVYLHLISATDRQRVQISNNKGRVNGWVPRTSVFGVATKIINP